MTRREISSSGSRFLDHLRPKRDLSEKAGERNASGWGHVTRGKAWSRDTFERRGVARFKINFGPLRPRGNAMFPEMASRYRVAQCAERKEDSSLRLVHNLIEIINTCLEFSSQSFEVRGYNPSFDFSPEESNRIIHWRNFQFGARNTKKRISNSFEERKSPSLREGFSMRMPMTKKKFTRRAKIW